jgi:hypothetical protein
MKNNLKKALGWSIIYVIGSLIFSLIAIEQGNPIKESLLAGLILTLLIMIIMLGFSKAIDLINN